MRETPLAKLNVHRARQRNCHRNKLHRKVACFGRGFETHQIASQHFARQQVRDYNHTKSITQPSIHNTSMKGKIERCKSNREPKYPGKQAFGSIQRQSGIARVSFLRQGNNASLGASIEKRTGTIPGASGSCTQMRDAAVRALIAVIYPRLARSTRERRKKRAPCTDSLPFVFLSFSSKPVTYALPTSRLLK